MTILPSIAKVLLLYSSIIKFSNAFHTPLLNTRHGHGSDHFQLISKIRSRELYSADSDTTDDIPIEIIVENDGSTSSSSSNRTVTILERGPNHIVAFKPPSVVCHHSGWSGSRAKLKRGEEPEIPMLQRVRDALHDIDSKGMAGDGSTSTSTEVRKVNLVHRLDRGASGALLLAYADSEEAKKDKSKKGATACLSEAMASDDSTKTYVALVRGEGILRGEDFKEKGWFEVSRPIKDESGEEKNATTLFNFVAGQPETFEDGVERPRISLVLARPKQGRWHQIRRHLNGLSHPILGDTTHGASKVNREWKEKRNLPGERICLHMARMEVPSTDAVPEGIDVSCPIPDDMLDMLRVYAPDVLEASLPVMEKEGIIVEANKDYEVGTFKIPEELLAKKEDKEVDDDVEILEQGDHYAIARKPPSVVVHHSSWTGKKSDAKRWREATPMLQRVRDKTGRRVNPIHRLDRGASGCLVFSFAQTSKNNNDDKAAVPCGVTKTLIESMQSQDACKTYLAICDGDGTWNDVNYLEKGWFTCERPVKDEWGKVMEDCRTDIRFIASAILPPIDDDDVAGGENTTSHHSRMMEGRKVSIILARPKTGRWHQVRQHLASGTIGHCIIGDSAHGFSRTNRIWKKKRNLMKERTCLHLARVQLPSTEYTPNGVDVSCPLAEDLMKILQEMPELLDEARPILLEEGIKI